MRKIIGALLVLGVIGFGVFYVVTAPSTIPTSALAEGFTPDLQNGETMFTIGWDGTVGTACNNKQQAVPGTYQVVAKLDTKLSAPTNFIVS